MKDVNGNVITSVAEQTQIWKSHFQTVLNKEAPNNLADIPVSDEDLEINTDPPSVEEVWKTVSSMKTGKAPGADGVSVDVLKHGGVIIVRTLIEIFEGIWEEEEIPIDWKTELSIELPKKGDFIMCYNWRGIALAIISVGFFVTE